MTLENRIANLTSTVKIKERILATYKKPEKSQLYLEIKNDKELLELLKELKMSYNPCSYCKNANPEEASDERYSCDGCRYTHPDFSDLEWSDNE